MDPIQMRPPSYADSELISLIQFHSIDIIVGAFSSLICVLTFFVFISSKQMMCRNKLLTLLAAADLCTSLGIFVLGLMRKALYEQVMETSRIPVEVW
uniref:G-protein coupled receptors family 1 profile domain-containing protein n=1 Tax=Globodera rostochiensis TaxID=31243 RepID=A0A914H7T5_GLORO